MTRLLMLLIERRYKISVDDILYNVWDRFNLDLSTQRLSQIMRLLKARLTHLVVDVELIKYANRCSQKNELGII